MAPVLALAGDTMLGRGVGDRLRDDPAVQVFGPRLRDAARDADSLVVNLECCISERGERWHDPDKLYFFRAPPRAVQVLLDLGVSAVSLANNHALDFGFDALADTLDLLHAGGITVVGAGADADSARAARTLDVGATRVTLLALADHPADFAASRSRAGIAFADLAGEVPDWVRTALQQSEPPVVVMPHWGPNMVQQPVPVVRRAARRLVEWGADLVAGHSAHIFHGVEGRVLYDLGDLVDDYYRSPLLRNDIGLLWLVHLDGGRLDHVDAVPLRLDLAFTEIADGEDAAWARRRFTKACAALGTHVQDAGDGRLRVRFPNGSRSGGARHGTRTAAPE
ncbi:MAG TPA: CapA family protein [Actinomycetales bacterium]|nr:CapA family protein [Actinomycetales bacterium]